MKGGSQYKRAQVSIEYLMIIGFVFIVIVPASILAYQSVQEHQDSVKLQQVEKALVQITRESEAVYYMGPPTRSIVEVYFPNGVFTSNVTNKEAIAVVRTSYGLVTVSVPTRINLTGNFTTTQGLHRLQIQAASSYVEVSDQ